MALAGVPGLVPRPVDIDQTSTGIKTPRTLRIYCFAPPQVIDGHAEEHEVFIVVLKGTVDLVIRSEHWSNNTTRFTLTAADPHTRASCAAYLPPHAEYALTPQSAAEVAYARALPTASRAPAVLTAAPCPDGPGAHVLLDDMSHAERLRLRLLQVDEGPRTATLNLGLESGSGEALVHVRTTPSRGAARVDTPGTAALMLESWDTIAVFAGECPKVRVAAGSSAFGMVVAAL